MKHLTGKERRSMKKIIGFYVKETSGMEYVLYESDGVKHLTNGVCDWTDKAEIYITYPEMKKVEKINIVLMIKRLNECRPYSDAIALLSTYKEN